MKIKTSAQLKRTLDKIFSQYVRRRDMKGNFGHCCGCGKIITYEESDASHFVSRQHLATRYDERNVHASCRKCNRFEEGNKDYYAWFLIKKYGPDIIAKLQDAKYQITINFPYQEMLELYKAKLKELDDPKRG